MRFRHTICTVLGTYSLKYVILLGFFFKIIFGCRPFLKFLLNLLQYCFCFLFFFFGHEAQGILDSHPGVEPALPALEGEVLTTGLPGKFQGVILFETEFILEENYNKSKLLLMIEI